MTLTNFDFNYLVLTSPIMAPQTQLSTALQNTSLIYEIRPELSHSLKSKNNKRNITLVKTSFLQNFEDVFVLQRQRMSPHEKVREKN